MNNYVIYTDSACDIYPEVLAQWGVGCVSLAFRFDHIDQDFKNEDMPIREFYRNMRDGHVAKTNAVNSQSFREVFEKVLAKGKDLLYLGFSSGLSTTFQQGKLAAEDLAAEYPDRKVIAIDTEGNHYRLQDRLRDLEDILPSYFIRINKSSLANEHRIDRFDTVFSGGVDAVFRCGYREYVSRRCYSQIKRRLENK